MFVTVRSFAKINLGLCIGPLRADGFHELRTIYQTIALHDVIRVEVTRGAGIEIRCEDPRVPKDQSNTCYRIVEPAMAALNAKGRVVIDIDKKLPVQGGLGGGSGNAISALLNALSQNKIRTGKALSGVLVPRGRGRAENPLLDLVRTGIENDFERVVFPKYPELIKVKRVLEDAGAFYASLSGSGSAIYGLFSSRPSAAKAAARLRKVGTPAVATSTLTRQQYWKKIFD